MNIVSIDRGLFNNQMFEIKLNSNQKFVAI